MRAALATIALVGLAVANPAPQAVTSAIAPSQSPPAGCYENYNGQFLIGPVNVSSSSKRDLDAAFEIIPLDKVSCEFTVTSHLHLTYAAEKHSTWYHLEEWYLNGSPGKDWLHRSKSAIPIRWPTTGRRHLDRGLFSVRQQSTGPWQ